MNDPKFLFITVGDITWASSRYRSFWPVKYLQGSKTMQLRPGVEITDEFDVYVWMKTGDLDVMKFLNKAGKLQFVEICDPNWWFEPDFVRRMVDEMSAVVAATKPAADDFREWYGPDKRIYVIPDRLELEHYSRRDEHTRADPVRFIWYGVAPNRVALFAAVANLERLAANGVNIELTICDNSPGSQWTLTEAFPVYYVPWSLDKEVQIIKAHDIALLPNYPGPWGKLKSNNKHLTAWACGLPSTTGEFYKELYTLATNHLARNNAASKAYEVLLGLYDVKFTARDWLEVVEMERSEQK